MSDVTASAEAVEEVQLSMQAAGLPDEQLIGQLVDRARASAAAVDSLLRALAQPPSARASSMYTVTLAMLGRAAFGAVVEALAAAARTDAESAVARRLGRVVRGFRTDCLTGYVGELHHESPVVRAAAAAGLGGCGSAAVPHADQLLPLLGDIGEPLPFEQQEHARLTAGGSDVEFEWEFALLEMAPNLAGALSINPLEVGASTSARGRGVLAQTRYGATYGVPPGALPI